MAMGKDGPNYMRPSAAEARLLHRCEVLAADLDHQGVHKRTAVENKEQYPITNTSSALCVTTQRTVDALAMLDRDVTARLTGRMSTRSRKPGPGALPCELHGCKAPTMHVQINRVCACAFGVVVSVDGILVSCETLPNSRVTESTHVTT